MSETGSATVSSLHDQGGGDDEHWQGDQRQHCKKTGRAAAEAEGAPCSDSGPPAAASQNVRA